MPALTLAVLLAHGCVADVWHDALQTSRAKADTPPPRIEVAYVREMALEAPRAVAVVATRTAPPRTDRSPRVRAPSPPASAASSAEPEAQANAADAASERTDTPRESEVAPAPAPDAAASTPLAIAQPASAASDATAAASPADNFDWPVSTRLSYVLTGNYRGPVHGSAQVEWIKQGTRYQVHLDVVVGLPFAPLLVRRMSSEGEVTPEGLVPHRYDEFTKPAFRDARAATLRFDADGVTLANGQRRMRLPGLQDSTSQFVQLAWAFALQPDRLQPGRTVDVPLALPRNVDFWTYDVREPETLYTPFGAIDAVPLTPRRVAKAGGDLTAEIWFAPALRYLPARIRIHQSEETYVDLLLEKKPELAAR